MNQNFHSRRVYSIEERAWLKQHSLSLPDGVHRGVLNTKKYTVLVSGSRQYLLFTHGGTPPLGSGVDKTVRQALCLNDDSSYAASVWREKPRRNPDPAPRTPWTTKRERAARELAVGLLGIPGLMQIIAYHDSQSKIYLIMPRATRPWSVQFSITPIEERALLFLDALIPAIRACAALHKRGWVHRDPHWDNLLFMPDGTVVLADFSRVQQNADPQLQLEDFRRLYVGTLRPTIESYIPKTEQEKLFAVASIVAELGKGTLTLQAAMPRLIEFTTFSWASPPTDEPSIDSDLS